jgi:hypothetical protein
MRNIELRAWDKKLKCFIYFNKPNQIQFWKSVSKYKMPVSRFTGLFDINNEKIWEDDIIQLNHFACDESCNEKHIIKIELEDGDFWPWMEGIEPFKSKKLGNIYENAYLMQ